MGISDGDGGYMGSYDTSYTNGDDAFADIHNLDHCIKYLNQSLVTFGFPSGLNLYSTEPTAIVRTCNCIYAMIQQRQRDIEYRETANDTRQRLMSDMSRLEAKVERLTDQMSSKERELQTLTSKEQKATAANRAQLERLQHEKDEFQRMVISTQQVKIQQMHELKKKEKEYIKLQERLNQVLMEKKKESKTGIEIMNLLQKEGRQRGTWNSKKADGDFYKMIVDAYEAKKQELLAENSDLRALLRSMQGDMRDFLNTPSGLIRPGTSVSSHELEPPATPLGGRTDVFDLPFHMARDQIEQSLREKMSSIKERMMQVQESQNGLQLARETSEREQVLEAQLVEARGIISEQATLMNKHMPGEDDSRSVITEQQEADSTYSPAEEAYGGTRPAIKEMALELAKECIAVEEARRRLEEEQASRASKVKPFEQLKAAKNQSDDFLEIIPPLYPVSPLESAPPTVQYAWVEDVATNFENLTKPGTPDYPSPDETWQENEITWTETQNALPTSSFQHPWLELDHLKKFTAPSKPLTLWQANEGIQLSLKLETYNNVIEKEQVAPPQDHNSKWPTSQISQPVTEIVWTDKDPWSQCPAEVPSLWQRTDGPPSEFYNYLPTSHDSQIWDAHEFPGVSPEVHIPKCFNSLPKSYDSGVPNVDEYVSSWPETPQSKASTSSSERHDYGPVCQTPPLIPESDQGDYTESGNLQSSFLEGDPGTNWTKCQIPPLTTLSGEGSYHNLESSLDFVLEVEVAVPHTPEIGSDRVSIRDKQVVGVENSSDMRWHSPKRPRCETHIPETAGWSASEESQYDSPECEPDLANSYSKEHTTTFLCADKLWFLSKFSKKKNISVGRGPLFESSGVAEDFYHRGKDSKNGTHQGSGRPQRVPLVSATGFQ